MTVTFDKTKFQAEKRGLNYFVDSHFAAINIRRIFELVWIAAGTAFQETFNEPTLTGFDFKMTGGNSDIDLNSSLQDIQKKIKSKSSLTFEYKITCDNGGEKYSDLNSRTSRQRYIRKMIEFIQSRALNRRLSIQQIQYKADGGGKNPRLYIQTRYEYKRPSKKRVGVIERASTNINFNFALKYAGSFSNKLDSLKPKDVKPSIVNTWLTPQQLYDNVITFITGSNFPSTNIETKKDYETAVKNSYNNLSLKDDLGIAPDMSSEFFEILSCLKLGNLLSKNDSTMKETFGLLDDNISMVQINIPEAANETLIDYKIAINGEINNPLKISVKSKVRGSSTATVKFTDAFKTEQEVNEWFDSIKFSRAKNFNTGQKQIVESALRYSKYSKKGMLYPIGAIVNLLGSSKASVVKQDFNKHVDTKSMSFDEFKKVIILIDKRIISISKIKQPIDEIIQDADILLKVKKLLADNTFRHGTGSAMKTKKTKECVGLSIEEATKKSYGGTYPFTVANVSLLCERVLVQTSYKESSSKFNFYKLFYDQILKKEAVVYSFTEVDDSGSESKLSYKFKSAQNFKQYKKWIALRTKNYGNNLQDTLGMAV